jgi:hypothetical protein
MNDLHEITGWLRAQVRQQPGIAAEPPPGICDLDAGNGLLLGVKEVRLHGRERIAHPRAGPG